MEKQIKQVLRLLAMDIREYMDQEKWVEDAKRALYPIIFNNTSQPVETDAWQLCPKCNGQGTVSKPPYVQGDIQQWTSSSAVHICDVCSGAKIIKR